MQTPHRPRRALVTATIMAGLLSTAAQAAPAYRVTNSDDDGPGSLRDALSSGATLIRIMPGVGDIHISDTLVYPFTAPLKLVGSGQTINGGGAGNTLLALSEGADLSISKLAFTDAREGGWQIAEGGGNGILVDVPIDRQGTVTLQLRDVSVSHTGDHGIHVFDCDLADCGAGGGGGGNGSPASVSVNLVNVTVDSAGTGQFDADGIRIDERGEGDIDFRARNARFVNVGADGIELDEGDAGDVRVRASGLHLEANGHYCAVIDDLENPEDPACVEDDDGELVLDLDDGFDIDEAGEGSVIGRIDRSLLMANLDEGLDLDEEGPGGFDMVLNRVRALDNADEGVKMSEEDDGDLFATLRRVVISDSDDDGMQLEEEDAGNLQVEISASVSLDNAKEDIKITQETAAAADSGTVTLRRVVFDSLELEDVDRL